jgi:DNA-binding GntR family transcriptional regulator
MTHEPDARTRSAPRYLAVTEALRAEITAASPNTLLPTEQQLARRFGVSRLTLRRALGLLERSGLVSRQRGRGTTVSPTKIRRLLAPLYTLEEDLRQQGLKLETRVLRYETNTEPPESVREELQLRRRSRVAVVELLRLVDGQVIAHDRAWVPTALAARFRPEECSWAGSRGRSRSCRARPRWRGRSASPRACWWWPAGPPRTRARGCRCPEASGAIASTA